jgi:hypothetical protein
MAFGNQPPYNQESPDTVAVPRELQLEIAPGARERFIIDAAALERVRTARASAMEGPRPLEPQSAVYPEYAGGHLATGVVATLPTQESIIDPRLMYAAHDPLNETYSPVGEAERIAREAAANAARQDLSRAYGSDIPAQYQDRSPSYTAPVEATMANPDLPADVDYVNRVLDDIEAQAAPSQVLSAANPELDTRMIRQEIDGIYGSQSGVRS